MSYISETFPNGEIELPRLSVQINLSVENNFKSFYTQVFTYV